VATGATGRRGRSARCSRVRRRPPWRERMDLIDVGANLTHKSFRGDLAAVVDRAAAAGVRRIVVTGASVPGSRAAADLAASRPGALYATAGVHPHDASRCDDRTLGDLAALAARPGVVAIGECGLDFNRDFSPRPVQRRWFAAQVDLAIALGKPLFLHERDAAEAFLAILDERRDRLVPAVVHCFTGTGDVLAAYLDRGLYIGITGWICDERRGTHLRALVREIPADRLLVETDAPYLLPRDLSPKPRGHRNEPAFLPHVVAAIAAYVGKPVEQVAAEATANAERFFGI